MKKVLFLFIVLFISFTFRGYAYTDDIQAESEELWQAVSDTFEIYGIHSQKPNKKVLTSHWIYDEVTRSRGLFKGIFRQNYDRRYRIKVTLIRADVKMISVEVRGAFQERSTGTGPSIPWKLIKPNSEDYQVEREFFIKILNQLAHNKRKAAKPPEVKLPALQEAPQELSL